MRWDAVMLDMDNTLMDFDRSEQQALNHLFNHYDISFEQANVDLYLTINSRLWGAVENQLISLTEVPGRRFWDFTAALGLSSDGDRMEEDYEEYLSQEHTLLAGALEVCETLSGRCRLYGATNGLSKVQHGRMERSGLRPFMSGFFISADIGYNKPMKAYFDHCIGQIESQIGRVERSSVLIVGDSLKSDIAGGLGAGLTTCWFNPQQRPRPETITPHYEIHRLEALLDLVD